MAVEAIGSRYTIKTNYLIAAACLVFGAWYFYDGWFNEKFQEEHTIRVKDEETGEETGEERPEPSLQMNRTWIPIFCWLVMTYFVVSSLRLRTKKIIADDEGLTLSNGQKIPYKNIRQIDKRLFKKKGRYTIEYDEDGRKKQMTLTEFKWDGLGLLLDEIVKGTKAKPAESLEAEAKSQDQSKEGF